MAVYWKEQEIWKQILESYLTIPLLSGVTLDKSHFPVIFNFLICTTGI